MPGTGGPPTKCELTEGSPFSRVFRAPGRHEGDKIWLIWMQKVDRGMLVASSNRGRAVVRAPWCRCRYGGWLEACGGEGSSLFWSRLLINNNNKHTTVQQQPFNNVAKTPHQRLAGRVGSAGGGQTRPRRVYSGSATLRARWLLHLGPAAISSIGRRD